MVICYYSDYQNVKDIADAKFIDIKKFCGEIEDGDSVVVEIEHAGIRKLYEGKGIKVEIMKKVGEDNECPQESSAPEDMDVIKPIKVKRSGRK